MKFCQCSLPRQPESRRTPLTAAAKQRFYYKGDRLKPLRAFCHAARLGSVSRAAEALFLSQPAITLQLQALERDMGTRLFERIGRRFTLTREGTALYELARPLVEGLDGTRGRVPQPAQGPGGRASCTSPPAARPSSICCRRS